MAVFTILYGNFYPSTWGVWANIYREIYQTDLSEFHPTVWEKSPEVQKKWIYHAVWELLLYF